MASRVGLIECLIVVVAVLEGGAAVEYTVGGTYGWHKPPNGSTDFYANWTSNNTFKIGDSVLFNWTGSSIPHNVDNVSKASYDNCTSGGQPNEGPLVTVNFTSNGTFYYICSVANHCHLGQKVTLVVGDGVSSTNTSDTNTGRGLSPSLNVGALTAVLSAIPIFFLGYI